MRLLEQDYQEKAKELIQKISELHIEKTKSFQDALKLVPTIIKAVENEYWGIAEADKKALAVAIINELVDIPFVPESVEAIVFGAAIDVAVGTLNQLIGQNWFERINR